MTEVLGKNDIHTMYRNYQRPEHGDDIGNLTINEIFSIFKTMKGFTTETLFVTYAFQSYACLFQTMDK